MIMIIGNSLKNADSEMVPVSKIGDIIKNYNEKISILILHLDDLLSKNEELERKVLSQNKQILSLQEQSLKASDENRELKKDMVKLEGALELFKNDVIDPNEPLEPQQSKIAKTRSDALDQLNIQVNQNYHSFLHFLFLPNSELKLLMPFAIFGKNLKTLIEQLINLRLNYNC